jgi:hypothetical protein
MAGKKTGIQWSFIQQDLDFVNDIRLLSCKKPNTQEELNRVAAEAEKN